MTESIEVMQNRITEATSLRDTLRTMQAEHKPLTTQYNLLGNFIAQCTLTIDSNTKGIAATRRRTT